MGSSANRSPPGPRLDCEAYCRQLLDRLGPAPSLQAALRATGDRSFEVRSTTAEGAPLAIDLSRHPRIAIAGLGKASLGQVQATAAWFRQHMPAQELELGPVVVKRGRAAADRESSDAEWPEILEAGHPVSDRGSQRAAQRLTQWLARLERDTLLVFCLSGGGSALLEDPRSPFTFEQQVAIGRALVDAGAPIDAVNALRSELSAVKGGGLAVHCNASRVLVLVTVDVPTDDLALVASGPFLPAERPANRIAALAGEWLPPDLAATVRTRLDGDERRAWQTALRASHRARTIDAVAIADWRSAARAAKHALSTRWPDVEVESAERALSAPLEIGLGTHHAWLRSLVDRPAPPRALLTAGELPVRVQTEAPGRGGRNSEFVLRLATSVWGERGQRASHLPAALSDRLLILSLATDGDDGPTGAAGGWLRRVDFERARALGLDPADYLARHDSLSFLDAAGTALVTGLSGTNLMDLHLLAIEP